ncbi:MAG: tetrathionate reductase family octaheme c-type cytochrome [Halomonadaceae bacterium]|nr:MAG: tetrathionate reductase family octaheme c-type cytochrome [Halomonadaceae bacterium]
MVEPEISRFHLSAGRASFRAALAVVLVCTAMSGFASQRPPPTADHSQFDVLKGPFENAQDVTHACLSCHTEAGKQIRATTHWTWIYDHAETGQELGKRKVINSFCGMVVTNEPRCTSCHVGYGWEDMNQPPPKADAAVDCLVCHDTTGDYRKFPTLSGHPTYIPREWPAGSGKMVYPPDLETIARNVGASGRATCGSCHFYGGGGDGVKHGDLDSSLIDPPRTLDVHMSKGGLDFTCADCHTSWGHNIAGSRYHITASDTAGIDVPLRPAPGRASCASCHGVTPHRQKKLNDHGDTLACQSCHIPEFARGGVPTKTWWDWSTAGQLDEAGEPFVEYDEYGYISYMSEKGHFRSEENLVPDYAWFDGVMRYTLADERLNVETPPVRINQAEGRPGDGNSRIWPFKIMRGKQPYDTELETLLATHVFGEKDRALWSNFNWTEALQAGSDLSGRPFSGHYDFIETTMHWLVTHMVPPASEALNCVACHSSESRLAGVPGIYMPGYHRSHWLDFVGWLLVTLTLVAVVLHGLARVVLRARRGP